MVKSGAGVIRMTLRILVIAIVLLAIAAIYSGVWLGRPVVEGELSEAVFTGMTLARPEKALTLAVSTGGDVLLVIGIEAAGIDAINISAVTGRTFKSAIGVYQDMGGHGIRELYDSAGPSSYEWEELGMPLLSQSSSIAVGTNYLAHAEEVGHEGEPFLFPKLSIPTSWNSTIAPGVRLDYEVEICAVPLAEYSQDSSVALGYVLCGDFTDRWLLVRDIDLDGAMGQTGFSLAKGGDSRLPIGPLLVIPRDDDFYRELTISLYVNDVLRQKSGADKMIWPPRQILQKALADCRTPYQFESQTVFIGDCESILPGTLLLTGTPAGVLFHPGTLWNPWAYLRAGDVVTSFATHLGYIRNEIGMN